MKNPKTVDDWRIEFNRLDAISRKQELTDRQSERLQRCIRMIDHNLNPPSPNPEWPESDVNTMADIIADGKTFAVVAETLGRSRSACIGRWRKVVRSLGW